MNFSVWDIEVVNDSPTSIATIGVVGVDKGEIVEEKEFYIKPEPFIFDKKMTSVNGLNEEDFIDLPTFTEVWDDLSKLLSKYDFCVAHNASFDFGIINSCCQQYKLSCKDFPVVDSLAYSRKPSLDVADHKLNTLCECLNINLYNHHSALCDARATAELMLKIIKLENDTILDVFCDGNVCFASDFNPRKRIGIKSDVKPKHNPNWGTHAKDVQAADIDISKNNVFNEKKIVISGELNSMDRKTAYSVLKACGAEVCDNLTMSTNYLITNAESTTGKIKKAKNYIERGIDIKIINEKEFLSILEEAHGTD